MNAPIRYYGGKGNMSGTILKEFPAPETYNVYIEPFGGSYGIGLKNKNIPEVEIFNDLDKNVYSLYKVLSSKRLFQKFRKKCDLVYYSQDLREEFIKSMAKDLNIVDRAFYFFYINRTSVNSIGGFSVHTNMIRRKMSKGVSALLSCIDRLPELHQRLSRVVILNTDGIKLVEKYNRINIFLYCDPPYEPSTRTNARYAIDMSREKHIKFVNAVISSKAKILISGYESDIYKILEENGFRKISNVINTVNSKNKPKTKIETLWKNY